MKTHLKLAVVVGALALAMAPAALAVQPADPGAKGKGPHYAPEKPDTPGPGASLPEKAKAYGVYCRGESKKHVKGEQGTAFSRCVNAMAKAAKNEKASPGKACKGLSKKHVKGQKGTEFSRCVNAAAKLREEQAAA
jgi:hypothetical protein